MYRLHRSLKSLPSETETLGNEKYHYTVKPAKKTVPEKKPQKPIVPSSQ